MEAVTSSIVAAGSGGKAISFVVSCGPTLNRRVRVAMITVSVSMSRW